MNQHTIDTLQLLVTLVRELEHESAHAEYSQFPDQIVVPRNTVLELIESLMRKELS